MDAADANARSARDPDTVMAFSHRVRDCNAVQMAMPVPMEAEPPDPIVPLVAAQIPAGTPPALVVPT